MEYEVQNQPDDTVAIICSISTIDEEKDEYAIVPREVKFGSIDYENNFVPEMGDIHYQDIDKFDGASTKDNMFYILPVSIDKLKKKYTTNSTDAYKKYQESAKATTLAVCYLQEIRNKIYTIYKDKSGRFVTKSISKNENELINKVNEEMEIKQYEIQRKKKPEVKSTTDDLLSIKRSDLAKYLKERIIGNDSIMDDIATIVVSNFRCTNPKEIMNILCVGPSGSGKTETFRQIANYANIPMVSYDCNPLSAAGYEGENIEDIFKKVYTECEGKMDRISRAILFLDEVDKIAARGSDVKDTLVQASLLKVLEGDVFSFNLGGRKQIDTTFMTKACAGAFMELFENNKQKNPLGFNQQKESLKDRTITKQDIIKYGFKTEFVGRLEDPIVYKPLDREGFIGLLSTTKGNALELQKERFKREYDCELVALREYLEAVVDEALKSPEGARGISHIINKSLLKLRAAFYDEQDEDHKLPKQFTLKKELVYNPKNFSL